MSSAHPVHMPRWASRFLQPARYKTAYGGRSSGKTWTFARLLIAEAAQKKLIIACGRQFQSSISVSAKPAMEVAIYDLGLGDRFVIRNNEIRGKNGSLIFFKGLERNREEIRGWESVDRVWIEEAQTLSKVTADILRPTIRKNGSELWFTWNPKNRTDWVWQRFIDNASDGDITEFVNWDRNPWFSEEADNERQELQKQDPGLYAHVWEGQPEDEGSVRRVLPYQLLRNCVEICTSTNRLAFLNDYHEGGLDVADGGGNLNAFVSRKSALITSVDHWRTGQGEGDVTARRVDTFAKENDIRRVFYDAGGVGAGPATAWRMMTDRNYVVKPVKFGSAVAGPNVPFNSRIENKDHFKFRNSQLGWAVRLRAENSTKYLRGEDNIDLRKCLLIDPDIPLLDTYLAQLAQPQWKEASNGKIEIVKFDETRETSPDLYDATVLAFAADSARGLRAR